MGKKGDGAATISIAVFVLSIIVCMTIIQEPYTLTFSSTISISLAFLTFKALSKKTGR